MDKNTLFDYHNEILLKELEIIPKKISGYDNLSLIIKLDYALLDQKSYSELVELVEKYCNLYI